MNRTYHMIAASMLGLESADALPGDLRKRLDDMDALCCAVGCELGSRQVVAVAVEQWQREHSAWLDRLSAEM